MDRLQGELLRGMLFRWTPFIQSFDLRLNILLARISWLIVLAGFRVWILLLRLADLISSMMMS